MREKPTMTNFCLRLLTAPVALAAASALSGCSALDNCPDALDDITIDRPEATHLDELVYESSAGWENFDAYPAKTQLRFKHGLGVTPYTVQTFLSFSKKGTNGKDGGSFTEGAGNEAAFECIDSHEIVLKNDTCERSFFVKIIAPAFPDGPVDDDSCAEK